MSVTNYNWTTFTTPQARTFAVKNDGNVGIGTADTGLTVSFTTSEAVTYCVIQFFAAYSGSSPLSISVIVNIDAVDTYTFQLANINNGAGGDSVAAWPGNVGVAHAFVASGAHSVNIRQSGANATLQANAASPATLVVDYQA